MLSEDNGCMSSNSPRQKSHYSSLSTFLIDLSSNLCIRRQSVISSPLISPLSRQAFISLIPALTLSFSRTIESVEALHSALVISRSLLEARRRRQTKNTAPTMRDKNTTKPRASPAIPPGERTALCGELRISNQFEIAEYPVSSPPVDGESLSCPEIQMPYCLSTCQTHCLPEECLCERTYSPCATSRTRQTNVLLPGES